MPDTPGTADTPATSDTPTAAPNAWLEPVRSFTEQLVRVRAFSPTTDERTVAQTILDLLLSGDLETAYTAIGLDPIEDDPFGRRNVFAFVQGRRAETVVLLGHFDTVDTADYGTLEPWATDPAGLAARVADLAAVTPGLREDLDAHPDDWMLGRGSIDMKSGIAANLAVIRDCARAAARGTPPAVSVLFLATPDEENESAGVLQAVRFLLRLRGERALTYLGAINTDYTTAQHPGDPHRYVYTGTIGKLLPSFLVVGRESHVGDPFDGLDANLLAAALIQDLSMNDDLCDRVRGQATPPPVTLRAADLKARYDVQLPFAAYFYLNVLTFRTGPAELLERMRLHAEAALSRVLERLDHAERLWRSGGDGAPPPWDTPPRSGVVLTYDELRRRAEERLGTDRVAAELAEEWDRWPDALDKRERSLHLVRRLWACGGERGPAVVVYYSPPYYPHVAAAPGALHAAVDRVVAAHPELNLVQREYYPYISDMSYLRLDPGVDTAALTANMPVWRAPTAPARGGAYTLPLDDIRALDLPVVNLGPYGRGAHQRGERVLMSYSFGVLPRLIHEVIESLA
ncbi:MAG TPA: M20/M25/M40 family metallo-hydrolase [Ktedonobacterales bacterium]